MYSVGFIGCGNMGKAMLKGIIASGFLSKDELWASTSSEDSLSLIKKEFDINTSLDNKEIVSRSDIIILAVKPYKYDDLIKELKKELKSKIIISIAPGKSIAYFEDILGKGSKIVRTMPNTPAMVSEAMTALCTNSNISDKELSFVMDLCSSFGKAEVIEEKLFDAVVAIAGSSPAYTFIYMEAMADAAVRAGMPRDKAYTFAAQAVLGSAKLLLESKEHPAKLKDQVCSPGGTTIEAVAVLEEEGFRSAVIKAMGAVVEKCGKM